MRLSDELLLEAIKVPGFQLDPPQAYTYIDQNGNTVTMDFWTRDVTPNTLALYERHQAEMKRRARGR